MERKTLRLLACFAGIMLFFLVYGVTQEKIMTTSYGETESERFKDTAFLVLLNRLVSILVSLSVILYIHPEPLSPSAPLESYGLISISNFMSTFCQYEALKYVTFPIQTLGKCAKMIPVLIIGTVTKRKQYSLREYLIGLLVMAGCFIFLTGGESAAARNQTSIESTGSQTIIGMFLIFAYLGFDGTTSTTQERLFKSFKTTTNNQMLYVNIFSSILSILTLVIPWNWWFSEGTELYSGPRLLPAIDFATSHPRFLVDALTLSICSSGGQLVIYYTIREFGALIYSTIMTTRQFFSILLSALIFMHPITWKQWAGSVLVFGALYWSAIVKNMARFEKKKRESDVSLNKMNVLPEPIR